mgnify:CR=1 FL=1
MGLLVQVQDERRHRTAPEVPGPTTRLAQLGSLQKPLRHRPRTCPRAEDRRGVLTCRGLPPGRPCSTRFPPRTPRRTRPGAPSTAPWTRRARSAWNARTTRDGTRTHPQPHPCPGTSRCRRTTTSDTRRRSDE